MKIETKSKHVLFHASDMFKREIEEVVEYYCVGHVMWAVARYSDNNKLVAIPLRALAIKN